jgi:hypothetical protein
MISGIPCSTIRRSLTFLILGLSVAGHPGCRSSHSQAEPAQLLGAVSPASPATANTLAAPDAPPPCQDRDLPPAKQADVDESGKLAGKNGPTRLALTTEVDDGCGGCGTNSPDINAFPFNGLHVDGCRNADGDQLRVDSLQRGASHCDKDGGGRPLFLGIAPRGVRKGGKASAYHGAGAPSERKPETETRPARAGYELVATNAQGEVVCTGGELAGMTFDVTSPRSQKRGADAPESLEISHVAETTVCYAKALPQKPASQPLDKFFKQLEGDKELWKLFRDASRLDLSSRGFDLQTLWSDGQADPSSSVDHATDCRIPGAIAAQRTVYLITRRDQPNHSLCRYNYFHDARRPDVRQAVTEVPYVMPTIYGSTSLLQLGKSELSSYAVIIPGAVFDNRGDTIKSSEDPAWFNIACVSDALGETDVSGLVPPAPVAKPDDTKLRLPAVHMFSAKYAGGVSATNRGTPLAWEPVAWQWKDAVSIELYQKQLHDLKGLWSRNQLRSRSNRIGSDIDRRPSDSAEAGPPPIEARWGISGATCLSHSRIFMPNRVIPVPEQVRASIARRIPSEASRANPSETSRVITEHFLQDEACFNSALAPDLKPCSEISADLTSFALGHTGHSGGTANLPGQGCAQR